ncbi:MAG: S41 family peptidase [Cyanobacteria bacterium P01_H01_bin.15]
MKRKQPSGAARFLRDAHAAVSTQLAVTVELSKFRATSPTMSRQDRLRLIEQALVLIEENYVHLPLKMAMHAVDPVQALKLLQNATRNSSDDDLPPASEFHREMIQIFSSARDIHTDYILPSPYNSMTAFLPFLIEPFFEGGKRRYLVAHVTDAFEEPPFEKGVEVLSWNGVPIERAVEINGDRYYGSNLEARHARGAETLTVRPLFRSLPPEEDWVIISYLGLDGAQYEIRVDWLVFQRTSRFEESPIPVRPDDAKLAYNIESEAVAEAKRILFAPEVIEAEQRIAMGESTTAQVGDDNLTTSLPKVFQARQVDSANGVFGYLRIRTFNEPPETFIPEVIRLIEQLPEQGLLIDVRGNGGGYIESGERMLQLFTSREIEPEPTQFLNSSVNLRLCERHAPSTIPGPGWEDFDLTPYLESMRQALRTSATYSNGVPITHPSNANAIGQIYHGPVVLITDALCYSTTDIFAAGFQDHEIGPILGVHNNTGAGGANVFTHSLLSFLFDAPTPDPESPYRALPGNAGLRVSIRRTLRVGTRAGTPLEDLGVTPDHLHQFTRNDLLSKNVDLINRATQLLSGLPKFQLKLSVDSRTAAELVFAVETLGLDRLDLYGDGRPEGSVDVTDGEMELMVPSRGFSVYEARGYVSDVLVASRKIEV